MLRISRDHLRLHLLITEEVADTKVHLVLHEVFVDLENLHPKVNIEEEHGYEDRYDREEEDAIHWLVV